MDFSITVHFRLWILFLSEHCSQKYLDIPSTSAVTQEWWSFDWRVAFVIHLHKDYGFGYLKKEVYRTVVEEMHSMKRVRMETSWEACCSY